MSYEKVSITWKEFKELQEDHRFNNDDIVFGERHGDKTAFVFGMFRTRHLKVVGGEAKDPKHKHCAICSANMTVGQIIEYCGCCSQPGKTCGGIAIRKSILLRELSELCEAENGDRNAD